MSDEVTTDQNESGENTPAWYRDAIARKDEQITTLRGKLLETQFKAAGVDTSKGLGKTMFESWPGDQIPESIEDIHTWAAERFEWSPAAGQQQTDPIQGQVQQQAQAHDRMNDAAGAGQSVDSDDVARLTKKIGEAEAKSDFATAFKLRTKRAELSSR